MAKTYNLKRLIVGSLRKIFFYSPLRRESLRNAKTSTQPTFRCATCQVEDFQSNEVMVDHIIPVVNPDEGFGGWDKFISALFCDPSNLQVLCKPCHKVKTQSENKTRKRKQQSNGKKS